MARAGEAVRKSFTALDGMLLGGIATGGLVAFGAGVRQIVGDVASLGDQAKRAGTSLEAFQEWKFVAEQNRIPLDAMSDSLKELNIRADEFAATGKGSAADAFKRLGMSPTEAKQRLKDPSAFLLEIIQRTRQLDAAGQLRTFDNLFGGSGGEKLVALLARSQDELRGTIQQAHDLGLVINDDLVKGAQDLDAKFNAVANTVGTALKTAIVEAATALSNFIEQFRAFDQQSTDGLKQRLRDIGLKKVEAGNDALRMQGMLDRGDTGFLGMNAGALTGGVEQAKAKVKELEDQEKQILDILDQREPIVWPPAGSTTAGATTLPATTTPPAGGSRGGSGGSARNPYAELLTQGRQFIEQQQLEQQALGMTTEAAAALRQQHELLNRAEQQGLTLTPQQRAEIAQLGTAMAEAEQKTKKLTAAQQGAQQAGQFLGDGLSNAFADVILGANSAEDAVKGLLEQLARAAIQAALMGNGPLGGMMGGTGLLSELFGGVKLAGGGEVRGPGTSTSDSIPAMLSNGEHVIRASEVRKHRALLHAINAGRIGRFADGGAVGRIASTATPHAPSSAVTINAPVTINASGGTPEQNSDLAKKTARELERTIRGLMADEARRQGRPGDLLARRS